jgi:hypothetical protein
MKKIFLLIPFVFGWIYMIAQSPSKPTNPFPNKNTPAPSQPTKVPPVTEQQIPPSRSGNQAPTTNPGPANNPPANNPSQPAKPSLPAITGTDKEQIIATIERLFIAMTASDSAMARPLFMPQTKLFTALVNANGQTRLVEEPIQSLLRIIGTPRKEKFDERILAYKIEIDGPLAQVWADYNLYIDQKFIHCGIDAFQLFKSAEGWKIFQLADTRRKTDCLPEPTEEIAKFLDQWHRDAAAANANAYFGAMTPDGVFLGTDASERWTREEFREWAKTYFETKKTWDFKSSKRNITLSDHGTLAWFDEELATWMGPCRGSGVLIKGSDGWKIKQYNLTVLVPNEKLQDYLKVIGAKK